MKQKSDLEEQIRNTLIQLYRNDFDIIERGVHEQCISAHFWYYFKREYEEYYTGLNIDIEYNKNGENLKCIAKGKSARPDMIIHKRGINKQNLLCVEFKKSEKEAEKDYEKLKKFTSELNGKEQYTYRYKYGVSVVITDDMQPSITWFENGKQEIPKKLDLRGDIGETKKISDKESM